MWGAAMKPDQASLKQKAAYAALDFIKMGHIIGLGSGSTVNYFVEALLSIKHKIEGVVAASLQTEKYLKQAGIPVLDLNSVGKLSLYIDGTDEVNAELQLIKGRGGALTREKIIAAASQYFVCIADESKFVSLLGQTALSVEVIPMARSYVAREIVKLGGFPIYREKFVTDNGNVILDTQGWDLTDPVRLERLLNNIPGIICNGLFAQRPADKLLLATEERGIQVLER
jgi:ribose 5-phosphate isomerase A